MTERKTYLVTFPAYCKEGGWVLTEKEIIKLAYLKLQGKDDSLEEYSDRRWIDANDPEYNADLDTDKVGGHYDRQWREGEMLEAAEECLWDDCKIYMIYDPSTQFDLFEKLAPKDFTKEDIIEFLQKQEIV